MTKKAITIVPNNKQPAVQREWPTQKQVRELTERLDDIVDYREELSAVKSGLSDAAEMSEKSLEKAKNTIEEFLASGMNQSVATLLKNDLGFLRPDGWCDDNFDPVPSSVSVVLANLMGSFPTSNIPNPKMFTRQLLEDVMALEPGFYEVEAACRKLRTSMKFMPSICEVVEAIQVEQKTWRERTYALSSVEFDHRDASKLLGAAVKRREAERQRIDEGNAARGFLICVGDRVGHRSYGHGIVKQILDVNYYRVDFGEHGEHRIVGEGFLERLAACEEEKPEDDASRGGA